MSLQAEIEVKDLFSLGEGSEKVDAPERRVSFMAISEHLCCDLGGEAVVLSLKNGKYYGMNSIGARIWELLQAPKTLSDIEQSILSEFEVEKSICRKEVNDFLALLKDEGLIEIVNGPVKEIFTPANGRKDPLY